MEDRRRRLLVKAQAEGRLPSVTGVVFDHYGAVWAGAVGPGASTQAQYRIGSITKTMTAVLVMQARDAGLLTLEDTLGQHLGDIGYAEVTLHDLLAHTSGMQSEPVGEWWERSRGTDFATLAARNDGSGRVWDAGTGYHYSNLGFAMLGEVAARRLGAPWRVLVSERLLGPLGMRRTSYLPRPQALPGWSVRHFTGEVDLEPLHDTGAMAPAGQLWSTLDDLVTWGQFLAGSHPDVLSAETLAEMQRPVTADYGLGLRLSVHAGGPLVGHTGSMPGFLAAVLVDPSSGIGSAVLSNATTGVDQLELAVALLEGDTEPGELPAEWVPTTSLPAEVDGVPGLWFWGNTALEARWHDGGLELRELGGRRMTDRFDVVGGVLRGVAGYHQGERLFVVRNPFGTVLHLTCATFVYTRERYGIDSPPM